MDSKELTVVFIKPSKYGPDGYVERFRRGFMPNSTLRHMAALTPNQIANRSVRVIIVDEYVETEIDYIRRLNGRECDVLAIVGTQSHQFHRALDLAAYARANGVSSIVIGGPHPMTCDTTEAQGKGISFSLAEGELVWQTILNDATKRGLQPVYGQEQRWQQELIAAPLSAPSRQELGRYFIPMLGIYPARGCPYTCNFCSVIKIAGQRIRSEELDTTLASLANAKRAGVRMVMFTSDNFNKVPQVKQLLRAMIEYKLTLPFFAQCDVQIGKDEELVALMAEAGCFTIFVGVESFARSILKSAHKFQNHPEQYEQIIKLCHGHGITSYFSNIIGFPEQDEAAIHEHLRQLKKMNPEVAAFYILTPIPGTEQYEDFLRAGLITEQNLDRFDAINSVWNHPAISSEKMQQLLFHCYRDFFSYPMITKKVMRRDWRGENIALRRGLSIFGSLFHRWSVWRGFHPMAGGIGIVRQDNAGDYSALRRKTFGFDLAALPSSLHLSAADLAFQRQKQ